MKIRGNAIFLMVLIVVMLIVLISSFQMEYFQSKLLPIIFAMIIIVASVVILRKELWGGKKDDKIPSDEDDDDKGEKKLWDNLVAGGWIVGFILATYVFGFIVSIPLLIISYMKTHGTRWLAAILTAVVTSALIYFAFEVFLRVTLERGLIYTLLGY